MAKLSETAEIRIAITFLVINLSTLLRQVYCLFMSLLVLKFIQYSEIITNKYLQAIAFF